MAAESMQDIKRRMKSVDSIEHVTNAMKLVSAAKLRRAKATFEKTNEFSHYIINSIAEVFNNAEEVPEKYLEGTREINRTCYLIVTRDHFQKRGYEIFEEYSEPPEDISFLESQEISRPIIDMYNNGEIDRVVLIYTAFISTLEQQVQNVTLLPFSIERDPEVMKYEKPVEYEPSEEEVFNYLVPKYVETSIYAAVVESATCEHAARRMAMENATDNAREMLGDLSLTYNRARQAAITNEILEVVTGAEAQK